MHRKFVEKVTQAEQQFAGGQTQGADELLEFLKTWLFNHIRVTDHQYAPFVKTFMEKEQAARKSRLPATTLRPSGSDQG